MSWLSPAAMLSHFTSTAPDMAAQPPGPSTVLGRPRACENCSHKGTSTVCLAVELGDTQPSFQREHQRCCHVFDSFWLVQSISEPCPITLTRSKYGTNSTWGQMERIHRLEVSLSKCYKVTSSTWPIPYIFATWPFSSGGYPTSARYPSRTAFNTTPTNTGFVWNTSRGIVKTLMSTSPRRI